MVGASDAMAWPGGDGRPESDKPTRRFRDLTTRTIAGIIVAAIAVAAILAGPIGVLVLTGLALGGVAAEWSRLNAKGLPRRVTIAGALYLLLAGFSFCYIYFGPNLDNLEEVARSSLLWFLAVVVANDCAAYGFGRVLGGPKLAPRISPKKTWSGAIGGLGGAGLIGILAGWGLGASAPVLLGVVALLLGALAQAGDLAESWVKRQVGVKDAGHLIPGHGGLLDRLDGLAAAAVGLAAIQLLAGSIPLEWS